MRWIRCGKQNRDKASKATYGSDKRAALGCCFLRAAKQTDGRYFLRFFAEKTEKVRKSLDEKKKNNYDNVCVLHSRQRGERWMYMVDYEGTTPVFAYAYLSQERRWTGPRAFRITIYQDDTLMFRTFNEREEVLESDFFYLVPGTAARLSEQIEHEGWWMGTVPLLIQADTTPRSTSMFGFAGHPMFRCEDLGSMIARDFGSHRGQLARGLYFMLENTAILLRQSNLILKLDGFEWDWAKASYFTPENAPAEITQPVVATKENAG